MPITVPNQRVVTIHRERATTDFLGIKNSHWQAAARDLGAHALMLYLYLASNANGFTLALSPTAIRQTIGMPPQTYRDQLFKLLDKGYLVQRGANQYDFYEAPRAVEQEENEANDNRSEDTNAVQNAPQGVENATGGTREININKIDKISGGEKQVSPAPTGREFRF